MQETFYTATRGINNSVDSARLAYDPKTGIIDLAAGTDILIDKSGGILSRRGSERVLTGEFISAYPNDESSFFAVENRVTDSALYKVTIGPNGEIVDKHGLRSSLSYNAKMDFCLVDGDTYYMNGFELGVINDGVSIDWPFSEWPRETETTAQFVSTPSGSHLDMLSGQFIISIGKEIQYTEHGLFGLVDNNRNWREFESRVLMVYSVGTGVYVSDEKAVYFLAGHNPEAWTPVKVFNYPAIEFCRSPGMVDPSTFGFATSSPAALFGTVNGPVVGLPDGQAFNLIDKRVIMPTGCSHGSIMVVDKTTIIQSGV